MECTMQAKVTKKFKFQGKTYFPGMIASGRAASFAVSEKCGVRHDAPPEKAMVPGRNKAAAPARNK